MIALEGLDCDMASLMSSGDGKYLLYIVNAKFVPGLKEEYGPQKCLKPGITCLLYTSDAADEIDANIQGALGNEILVK